MMTTESILSLPVHSHHVDGVKVVTIRQYFFDLLKTLWLEQDEFSGKRPWGSSGWEYDVYATLIMYQLIPGDLDEDGCVTAINEKEAKEFVLNKIIHPLLRGPKVAQ